MSSLNAYLPQDRLRALAQRKELPDRTTGAALFADIAGFTALTESLTRRFGPRRGSEELTRQMNAVFDAIIAAIEAYDGSVLSFAGDAITCWFDGDNGLRAAAAACAQQVAMKSFAALGLKSAVTVGPARRFCVGDPGIQRMDALAGAPIARLAGGEHLAVRGEVMIDLQAADLLASHVTRGEVRTGPGAEQFAVVKGMTGAPAPKGRDAVPNLGDDVLLSWILPAVFEEERSGHGAFLTELRPAAALFLNFTGVDYEADDEAGAKLDSLVRHVQAILARYEGTFLQLNIGDKGSYLYAVFGAPVAHEDDARRAVNAALELRALPSALPWLPAVQIGVSTGVMLIGAYGGSTRRTYGALGDEVNLAARLMGTAAAGEVLVSGRVQAEGARAFSFEPRPPITLKGKAEAYPVFAVGGQSHRRAVSLEEPRYALPMMGRKAELQLIESRLALARQGKGQVIGITAEAGLGKSRLAAEVIRLAHRGGFTCYGGACESSGVNTPYLVWRPVWQAFFDLDPAAPLRRQVRNLEGEVEDRSPGRVQAIPVLSPLLDVPIEENEFTRTLKPEERKSVLTAILEECLRSSAAEKPMLLVLEDLHWIDSLSLDLLESLARSSATMQVCILLAYRPPEAVRPRSERLESLPHFTRVTLTHLTAEEAEGLIRAKLALLLPERTAALPRALTLQLMKRSEGNPFYIEELLNYLHERGVSPDEEEAMRSIELPASLHALILSRMDRLSETEKIALKTASIIGRTFRLSWLHGYYPGLGELARLKDDLEKLAQLDLTPLDTPEPERVYLFKHIVTREVAYESLSFQMRAQLHEQFAQFLEHHDAERYLPLLAYHYGESSNKAKQREYLRKAGDAAQAVCSYDAAVDHFTRLLPLVDDPGERFELHRRLVEAHFHLADFAAVRASIDELLRLAQTPAARAAAKVELGRMASQVEADYARASQVLGEALELARAGDDRSVLSRVLYALGDINWRLGTLEKARGYLEESLALARSMNDVPRILFALNRLGTVSQENPDVAEPFLAETLQLAKTSGNRERAMAALNNLGDVSRKRGDWARARAQHEQALAIARELGARQDVALFLLNVSADAAVLKDLPGGAHRPAGGFAPGARAFLAA